MRLPRISAKLLIRAAAIGLAALAIMRAAVELSGIDPSRSLAGDAISTSSDTFDRELERCRHLAPEQANDTACRRAWAESRRRFLGHSAGHGA